MFDKDERYHLFNDDCMKLLPDLAGKNIKVIATDIPYNELNKIHSNGLRQIDKGAADDSPVDIPFLCELFSKIAESAYIFCGTEQSSSIRASLVKNRMSTRQMFWKKSNPSPMNAQSIYLSSVECCVYGKRPKATFNGFYEHPVFEGPIEKIEGFPTPKPVWLCKKIIDMSSNIGDIILDPFMGSGSFIVAALQLGRLSIGIELNKEYFEIAKKRIESV
jgi:site-specific DNA-methyltransferase (adenine-specific)